MTDFTILATLETPVAIHLAAASVALVVGPLAIYRKSRDWLHKSAGYVWVLAILVAAGSSFGLTGSLLPLAFGFGAIHLLAVWAIVSVCLGVNDARQNRIGAHKGRMSGLYWQGVCIAGLLTLLPGRVMNEALFGQRSDLGLWVIGGWAALIIGRWVWRRIGGASAIFSPPPSQGLRPQLKTARLSDHVRSWRNW